MDRQEWLAERQASAVAAAGHRVVGREQVIQWLAGEGLTVIDEGSKWEVGWGYRWPPHRSERARPIATPYGDERDHRWRPAGRSRDRGPRP